MTDWAAHLRRRTGVPRSYQPLVALTIRTTDNIIGTFFAVEPLDDEAAIHDKVAGRLLALGEADPDVLSPLLSLLDVPVPDASWARREPRERRALTIDAVKRLFRRASDERPLLLLCEDLHWTDGETQAVLDALVDCVPTARCMTL